jgi:hypothetical protein
MPFSEDPGVREDPRYCSYCFRDGKFSYEGHDLKEFQKACYDAMVGHGVNRFKAKFFAWMIRFAPRWKGKTEVK